MPLLPLLFMCHVGLAVAAPVNSGTLAIGAVGPGESDATASAAGDLVVWAGKGLWSATRSTSGSWSREQIVRRGELVEGPLALRIATNGRGDAAAVWLTYHPGGPPAYDTRPHYDLWVVRRPVGGAWRRPERLIEQGISVDLTGPDPGPQVAVTDDGTAIVAGVILDGRAGVWERSPRASIWTLSRFGERAAGMPARAWLGLAVSAAGRASILWTAPVVAGTQQLRFAERGPRGWALTEPPARGRNVAYPVLASDRRTVAAWYVVGRGVFASEHSSGVWSTPRRLGTGVVPQAAAHGSRVAVAWSTGDSGEATGVAVQSSGSARWVTAKALSLSRARLAVGPGGAVVVGTGAQSGAVGWSALLPGASRWTSIRYLSQPADFSSIALTRLAAPAASGALGTALWVGGVRPGRLGLRRDGSALQFADLKVKSGNDGAGAARLSLEGTAKQVPVRALAQLVVQFNHYTGPVTGTVQHRRFGRWQSLTTVHLDQNRPVRLRFGTAGLERLRVAYGPKGARHFTRAVQIRVVRTGQRRVVAGYAPTSIAAIGNDLWVVSSTETGRGELRLLDAETGRLRRGPVAVASGAALTRYDTTVLLDGVVPTAGLVPKEDAMILTSGSIASGRPRLTGGRGHIDFGFNAPGGRPARFVVNGRSVPLRGRQAGAYALGPDAAWSFQPAPDEQQPADGDTIGAVAVHDLSTLAVVAVSPTIGAFGGHAGRNSDLIAVKGAAWERNADNAVRRVSLDGSLVDAGGGHFTALELDGSDVWGLNGDALVPSIQLLPAAGGPSTHPSVSVGQTSLDPLQLAIGRTTGWVIANQEQTLVAVRLRR